MSKIKKPSKGRASQKTLSSALALGATAAIADQFSSLLGQNNTVASVSDIDATANALMQFASSVPADLRADSLFQDVTAQQLVAASDFTPVASEAPLLQDIVIAQANTANPTPATASAAPAAASAAPEAAAAASMSAAVPVLGALGLAALAGGGGGSDPGDGGVLVDGYLAGATVSRVDGSGNTVISDANGNFTGLTGSGAIKATGGTDLTTGQPFTGVLFAPEGSAVVSPLTTLVQKLVESGSTVDAAVALVQEKFGLGDFDILDVDPLAAANEGDPAALEAFKAGVAVATVLQTLAEGGEEAFDALAEALAVSLQDLSGGVPLTDVNFLNQLVDDAQTDNPDVTFGEFSTADQNILLAGLAAIDNATSVTEVADVQETVIASTLPLTDGIANFANDADPDLQSITYTKTNGNVFVADSVSDLADAGITRVTGDIGVPNSYLSGDGQLVWVEGGFGDAFGANASSPVLPGVTFDPELRVVVDVSDAAGTVTLNTSLAGLQTLGVDLVTGLDGQDVILNQGFGQAGVTSWSTLVADAIPNPGFSPFGTVTNDLDVTINISDDSAAGLGGSVMINNGLGFTNLGIDHVIGVDGQLVKVNASGNDSTTFANQELDLASNGSSLFADNLDVVYFDSADNGSDLTGGLTLKDLADLGVDYIRDTKSDTINIEAGVATDLTTEADLAQALVDLVIGQIYADGQEGSIFDTDATVNLVVTGANYESFDMATLESAIDTVILNDYGQEVLDNGDEGIDFITLKNLT